MGRILNAFRTTAGEIFEKKEDSIGRTYYVQKGDGRVSRESYAGANRSLEHVITDDDGDFFPEVREATTAEELEDATGIPFTARFFEPTEVDGMSKGDALQAEANRFLGFWSRNDHLDRTEAAKRYLEFRNDLRGVEDSEARAIIKSRYNVGGS